MSYLIILRKQIRENTQKSRSRQVETAADRHKNYQEEIREPSKYYFADFVRKGGTPPPLRIFFPAKKELRIWGVPPSPPLRIFPRKFVFKKG